MSLTPELILRRAAALISERGLVKGGLSDGQGAYCSLGALRMATAGSINPPGLDRGLSAEDLDAYQDACVALRDEIRYYASTGSGSIPAWNDMPNRKKDEVSRVMLAAADRVESARGGS